MEHLACLGILAFALIFAVSVWIILTDPKPGRDELEERRREALRRLLK